MKKTTNFSSEVRERAVRMVREHQGEHESQWAAICSIATKIGCTAETLRRWIRQSEKDGGERGGGDDRRAGKDQGVGAGGGNFSKSPGGPQTDKASARWRMSVGKGGMARPSRMRSSK
ncbi:hypothetical protein MishRS11D_43060 (plasmid) [Methylomagnum ishizawai]|nr:hypothetical protein MishRS11D_43060 [Methylomagnum ishizawai]